MDSSGHYFSEYSNSKRYNDWREQYSDGSNRVLQLRFRQVIRCGSYGFALITNISFLFLEARASNVYVYRIFSDSRDETFVSTSDYVDWMLS
jgi:hypothetical protein